jgi:NAD(P)-dependent dehydrogenase (short-subunit alcohol dehydrogenase family)
MPRRLEGKTAMVTGGARGIGRATVERFCAEGAHVIAVDTIEPPGNRDTVQCVQADVTDAQAIGQALGSAVQGRRLDICVANAGISSVEDFLDGSPDSWLPVLRVNLLGVMVCLQAAAKLMVADGLGGRLLATSSIAGIKGEPLIAAYSASKGAVAALIKALAVELAPYKITANAVAPGQIATDLNAADARIVGRREGKTGEEVQADAIANLIPAKRMGEAAEVAALFAFLASDDAAFITGTVIRIDGAETTL